MHIYMYIYIYLCINIYIYIYIYIYICIYKQCVLHHGFVVTPHALGHIMYVNRTSYAQVHELLKPLW